MIDTLIFGIEIFVKLGLFGAGLIVTGMFLFVIFAITGKLIDKIIGSWFL
jgi:hypothetical protein